MIKGTIFASTSTPFRWEWMNEISINFDNPKQIGPTLLSNGFMLFKDINNNELRVVRDVLYFNDKLIYASAMDHATEINRFIDHLKQLKENGLDYVSTFNCGQYIELTDDDYEIEYELETIQYETNETDYITMGNELWYPIGREEFEEFHAVCEYETVTCSLQISDDYTLVNKHSPHLGNNQILYDYTEDEECYAKLFKELRTYHKAIEKYDNSGSLNPITKYRLYKKAHK